MWGAERIRTTGCIEESSDEVDLNFFIKGLIIGISIAAPVGPIGVLCIRRTLAHGRSSGFFSGLGAATADACYGCVAAFGLTFISDFLVGQQFWMRLIGGTFLCYLGVKTLLEKPVGVANSEERQSVRADSGEDLAPANQTGKIEIRKPTESIGEHKGLAADYMSTLLLTLTNPMTILSFAAIFAGLGIASSGGEFSSALILVSGVFLGSASWWLILSTATNLFRTRFLKPAGLRWVNYISGAIIAGFGIFALSSIKWN